MPHSNIERCGLGCPWLLDGTNVFLDFRPGETCSADGSEHMTLLTTERLKLTRTMIMGIDEEHAPYHERPLFPRRTSRGPQADGPVLIDQNLDHAPHGRKEVKAADATFSSVPELVWFRLSYGCYQSANMVGSGPRRPHPDAHNHKQLAF